MSNGASQVRNLVRAAAGTVELMASSTIQDVMLAACLAGSERRRRER
jgi:hypothetical protein